MATKKSNMRKTKPVRQSRNDRSAQGPHRNENRNRIRNAIESGLVTPIRGPRGGKTGYYKIRNTKRGAALAKQLGHRVGAKNLKEGRLWVTYKANGNEHSKK